MTSLRYGSASDTGRVRSNNQDAWLEADTLFAVADGMGGHTGGEVASSVAVQALRDYRDEGLTRAVKFANRAVWARADDEPALRGMGTTMTALSLVPAPEEDGGDLLLIANVGDSRTYLLRDGELTQLTEDHSLVEDLVREGRITEAEARIHPQRNILTRVLGNEPDVEVDEFSVIPVEGDRYLLCSDGLFNELDDDRIAAVLRRLADPGEVAVELVRLANDVGGRDNITVVVVDVVDDGDAAARASDALAANGVTSRPRAPEAPVVESGLDDDEPVARAAPPPPAGPLPPALRAPRRLTWRSTLFVVAVLAVVGGAVGAVWWFSTSTYFVGVDGDRVAIFRGRPGGVLWLDPTLELRTDLPVADVPPSRIEAVRAGQEEPSLEAAQRYVANLEDEASTRSTTTTTTSTTSTATAVTTTVPTVTTTGPVVTAAP